MGRNFENSVLSVRDGREALRPRRELCSLWGPFVKEGTILGQAGRRRTLNSCHKPWRYGSLSAPHPWTQGGFRNAVEATDTMLWCHSHAEQRKSESKSLFSSQSSNNFSFCSAGPLTASIFSCTNNLCPPMASVLLPLAKESSEKVIVFIHEQKPQVDKWCLTDRCLEDQHSKSAALVSVWCLPMVQASL